MSNTPSLLGCPFCGSAAHFESDSDGWHWVECESCGMQGNRGASLMEDCKPMLAEAWNRRTPQPVVREPQPMPDLTQLTERGAEAWAGVDAQALRAGLEPLHPVEAMRILLDVDSKRQYVRGTTNWAVAVTRAIEAAHGITQKGDQ